MSIELSFANSTNHPRKLYLEPWGKERTIPPGAQLHVLCTLGDNKECLEVDYLEDGVLLYFPSGSVAEFVADAE